MLLHCVSVIRNGRSIHRLIIYTLCNYWHIILYSRITFLSIHTPYKSVILMVSIICEIVKLWIKLFTNPNSFPYSQFARIFYFTLFSFVFYSAIAETEKTRKGEIPDLVLGLGQIPDRGLGPQVETTKAETDQGTSFVHAYCLHNYFYLLCRCMFFLQLFVFPLLFLMLLVHLVHC